MVVERDVLKLVLVQVEVVQIGKVKVIFKQQIRNY